MKNAKEAKTNLSRKALALLLCVMMVATTISSSNLAEVLALDNNPTSTSTEEVSNEGEGSSTPEVSGTAESVVNESPSAELVTSEETEAIEYNIADGSIDIVNSGTNGFAIGEQTFTSTDTIKITGSSESNTVTVDASNATSENSINIELANMTMSAGAPFVITSGYVNMTLTGTNSITSTTVGKAAINVPEKSGLTISGVGSLTATAAGTETSDNGGAGIGGNTEETAGTIKVKSGIIKATGGNYGAGIGGGYKGNGGTITISGVAVVSAIGGHSAAGIGSGYNESYGGKLMVIGSPVIRAYADSPDKAIDATVIDSNVSFISQNINHNASTQNLILTPTYTNSDGKQYEDKIAFTFPDTGNYASYAGTMEYATKDGDTYYTIKNESGTTLKDTTNFSSKMATSVPGSAQLTYTDVTFDSSFLDIDLNAGSITIQPDDDPTLVEIVQGDKTSTCPTTGEIYIYDSNYEGEKGNTITVADGVGSDEAPLNITLGQDADNNYKPINVNANSGAAMDIQGASNVNITLTGNGEIISQHNVLKGSDNYAGLQVESYWFDTATVTIGGSGVLDATGGLYGAGIGAGNNGDAGTINISSGIINATSGGTNSGGAGIGGGSNGDAGTINIYGGDITAKGNSGDYGSAGIGGGSNGSGGITTITGGKIDAYGGAMDDTGDNSKIGGAGIGGGEHGAGGKIVITGGRVEAQGGEKAAGIGGGGGDQGVTSSGCAGTIIIGTDGSTDELIPDVIATGGIYGAGIGTGNNATSRNNNSITIKSGTVTATAGNCAAGIGSGAATSKQPTIDITGGTITARGGNNEDGDNTKGGAGIGSGAYDANVSGSGTPSTITITGGEIYATGGGDNYGGAGIGGGGAKAKGITSGGIITIGGTAKIARAEGGSGGAGIGGGCYGNSGTITIKDSANIGSERLEGAIAGEGAAGIGTGYLPYRETAKTDTGSITISTTGIVNAISTAIERDDRDLCGAGIGGGVHFNNNKIEITNATIYATSAQDTTFGGAGIGGGEGASGGTINISNSTVTATGSVSIGGGAGIGGGYDGSGGETTINGGIINATGGTNGAGIGSGCNGDDGGTLEIIGDPLIRAYADLANKAIDATVTGDDSVNLISQNLRRNNTTENIILTPVYNSEASPETAFTFPESGNYISYAGTMEHSANGKDNYYTLTDASGKTLQKTCDFSTEMETSAPESEALNYTDVTLDTDTVTVDLNAGSIKIEANDDSSVKILQDDKTLVCPITSGLYIYDSNVEKNSSNTITVLDGVGNADVPLNIMLGIGIDDSYKPINIKASNAAAMSIQGNSNVKLILADPGDDETVNVLQGGATGSNYECAALEVQPNATITITGEGTLNATGNRNGAGIGGSRGENSGNIIIEGDTVINASSENGAGIGGGSRASGGNTTIKGNATVTATSLGYNGNGGAGIGGGTKDGTGGDAGTIKIQDAAKVTATGVHGAGIGKGKNGSDGSLEISGTPTIRAYSAQSDKAIDAKVSGNANLVAHNITNIETTEGLKLTPKYIDIENEKDLSETAFTFPDSGNYTSYAGTMKYSVSGDNEYYVFKGENPKILQYTNNFSSKILTTNLNELSSGTLEYAQVELGSNFDLNEGSITIEPNDDSTVKIVQGSTTTKVDKNDNICICDSDNSKNNANVITVKDGVGTNEAPLNLTLGVDLEGNYKPLNIEANGTAAIDIQGASNVNLTLAGGETAADNPNILKGSSNCAGLQVQNKDNKTATVTIDGTGALKAIGGQKAAGIGGGYDSSGGTINIISGTINAIGGERAAGIGGGGNDGSKISGGCAGTITIGDTNNTESNPTVTANGGIYAAGIGTGNYTTVGNGSDSITINSGTVNATAGNCAAGIGSGASTSEQPSINIAGGIVNAQGGTDEDGDNAKGGAGIGSGTYNENVSGSGTPSKISITGGTINATGSGTNYGGAGIGGGGSKTKGVTSGGTITIGGTATIEKAEGGLGGAGIGGGIYGTSGTITITDSANIGTAETAGAIAGEGAAGIGTGYLTYSDSPRTDTGNIKISTTGTVNATSTAINRDNTYYSGAGIGGGVNFNNNNIEITNGTIIAEADATEVYTGAGIGGGARGAGGTIKITGGVINACGDTGIGGGYGASGGTLEATNNSTIRAYSNTKNNAINSVISGGANFIAHNLPSSTTTTPLELTPQYNNSGNKETTFDFPDSGNYISYAGTVENPTSDDIYYTLTDKDKRVIKDLENLDSKMSTFNPQSQQLEYTDVILDSTDFDLDEGSITIKSNEIPTILDITQDGITSSCAIDNSINIYDSSISNNTSNNITIIGDASNNENPIKINMGKKDLGENTEDSYQPLFINTGSGPAMSIQGNANVELTLETNQGMNWRCSNTLCGGSGYAGLQVSSTATITIDGIGTLRAIGGTAQSDHGGAGIGGNANESAGTINIKSGKIEAQGGKKAAGIGGGGNSGTNSGGCAGTITIGSSDATNNITPNVTATGGLNGAGIGTGNNATEGNGSNSITINSGTVNATGGDCATGIGSGASTSEQPSINITGGKAIATGAGTTNGGAGIGGETTISGGEVSATGGGSVAGISGNLTITGTPVITSENDVIGNANVNSECSMIYGQMSTPITGAKDIDVVDSSRTAERSVTIPEGTKSFILPTNSSGEYELGNATDECYLQCTDANSQMSQTFISERLTSLETPIIIKAENSENAYPGIIITDNMVSEIGSQIYTGEEIKPTVTVKDDDTELKEGTDYTVSYSNNINVGKATATIKGKGQYGGKVNVNFDITAKEITEGMISIDPQTYTGLALEPAVTVTDGDNGNTLINGTDYTVVYSNNINAGDATATVEGKGNYIGKVNKTFKIAAKPITTEMLSSIDPQTYTGLALEPTVTVTDGTITLTKDTDYTVAYSNNVNVGTEETKATATVTGIGNYSGDAQVSFTITPKEITTEMVSPIEPQIYTGSAQEPAVTVTDGTITLTKDTDYTVIYSENNTNVGTGTVTVTGIGNYSGDTAVTFDITPKEITTEMVSPIEPQTYTGSALEPTVTVKYGTITLAEGTDYTVVYSNNINAGDATATVEGKGNYTGKVNKTFKIAAETIINEMISSIDPQTYTGLALEPTVTVTYGTITLTKDTDYTVVYSNNVNAGDATVTVTGTGNYSGDAQVSFTITAKEITEDMISIESPTYTGSAQEPAVTVKDGEKVLAAGTDYTVAYSNNVNVGTEETKATATVTGIGNYTGNPTANFSISAKQLSAKIEDTTEDHKYIIEAGDTLVANADGIVSADKNTTTYSYQWQSKESDGDFVDITGANGSTYTVPKDAPQAAQYRVKVTAQKDGSDDGNYGSAESNVLTVKGIELNAKLIIPETGFTYNGEVQNPTVEVTTGNGREITPDNEKLGYKVKYSADNVEARNAGTYTLTIEPTGEFKGYVESIIYVGGEGENSNEYTINKAELIPTAQAKDKKYDGTTAATGSISVTGINGEKPTATAASYTFEDKNVGTDKTVTANEITLPSDNDVNKNYKPSTASATTTANITAKEITEGMISIDPQTYTGSALEPTVTVKDGATTLTEGTDYELTYSNNVNVGDATATVRGIGNYSGDAEVNFTISAKQLSAKIEDTTEDHKYIIEAGDTLIANADGIVATDADTTYSYQWQSKESDGDFVDITGANGSTYTVPKDAPQAAQYRVKVTAQKGGSDDGNYESAVSNVLTVGKIELNAKLIIPETGFTYSGEVQNPTVEVTTGNGRKITPDNEKLGYKVKYSADNVEARNAGTYTLTIEPTGTYAQYVASTIYVGGEGEKSNEYTINKAELIPTVQAESKEYDGTTAATGSISVTGINGEKPTATAASYTFEDENVGTDKTVTANEITLPSDNDVNKNYKPSTATATTTANITAKEITKKMVSIPPQAYTGEEIKPEVTVKDGEKVLTEDIDYTVTCSNNIEIGIATATIEGIGNYKGKVDKTFEIALGPEITSQPQDTKIDRDETATFSVTAKGTTESEPLTYNWQVSTDNGESFTDIPEATEASYTTPAVTLAMSGYQYRCVVSNEKVSVTSNSAKLTIGLV